VVEFDQIIKGCRQYNKFAQKMLYKQFAPQMHGLCFRYLGDEEITKDIVQEGFIKVFSNIKMFKGKGSFEGWMKRIFVNTAISYIRKNKKNQKHYSFDEVNEVNFNGLNGQSVDDLEIFNEQDEESALENLTEEELLSALKKVPEAFRTVFNLYCIENIRHDEIAKMLKISVATSRTRLSRARGYLQKELYAMCHVKLRQ
jgi:RNA polymerase sigma-70 factor (ECF subfamily)